jgi:ATP-dependent 26S proteasome regulatory subunit
VDERDIQRERVQNLWNSFARKFPPVQQATRLDPAPSFDFDQIGGLAAAKEELLTYACGATSPEIYTRWGTFPPSGLLLLGRRGVGKQMLAHALATRAGTAFVYVSVPHLVMEVLHTGGKVRELLDGWSEVLADLPAATVFFDELEFSQVQDIGTQRTDLPIGPIMDFLLELVDRTAGVHATLAVASTSAPQSLRPAFVAPGRFERIVEVTPIVPDDIVAALLIHAAAAEKRAGRRLFEDVDWTRAVMAYSQPPTGDWVRILHATLRRKARCEAAGEEVSGVNTDDLLAEVERARRADGRLLAAGGTYL